MKQRSSYGSGVVSGADLARCGQNVIIEPDARIFHPEHVELSDRVYVGHFAVLHGYHRREGGLRIGAGSFVGQHTLLHGAGGLDIGRRVGIGAGVRILTSSHTDPGRHRALIEGALRFAPVRIGDGSDLGVNAVVLPGVTVGQGVQIAAGAVVTRDLPDFAVAVGVPAQVTRLR
jgi:acetyltransferase-like isoleucine patch superfamily enzyme